MPPYSLMTALRLHLLSAPPCLLLRHRNTASGLLWALYHHQFHGVYLLWCEGSLFDRLHRVSLSEDSTWWKYCIGMKAPAPFVVLSRSRAMRHFLEQSFLGPASDWETTYRSLTDSLFPPGVRRGARRTISCAVRLFRQEWFQWPYLGFVGIYAFLFVYETFFPLLKFVLLWSQLPSFRFTIFCLLSVSPILSLLTVLGWFYDFYLHL